MLFVAVLAALSSVALSEPLPCLVGPWSAWGDCESHRICRPSEVPQSYEMSPQQKSQGVGRRAMQRLMWLKTKTNREKRQCMADGSCPEMTPPASVTGRFAACIDGIADGIFPCNNVDMLAFLSHDDLGYANSAGNDLWVWHDTERGDDYVLMGHTTGTSFVRITDPINPEPLGILDTESDPSTWRDMKVIGNYAFIVSEALEHGMQVFDLTKLRDLLPNKRRVFEADVLYTEISNTHNIVANPATNTVFLVGNTWPGQDTGDLCRGGLHMVDVSDPLNPTFAGCFEEDGYVHDAECIIYDGPDTNYIGREICFCYNEEDFTIADVTDRSSPIMVSRRGYLGSAYTHQGWVTEDRKYAVMNDELDEYNGFEKNTKTYVWDIQDLSRPSLIDTFVSTETSIDHNLYIRGDFVHQSNYEAGYRLLNIDEDGALAEVAYFDVWPISTEAQFYGTWSNYPWLGPNENPHVVVSSIEFGLFILQPNMAQIERDLELLKTGSQSRTRDVLYNPLKLQCPILEETRECEMDRC